MKALVKSRAEKAFGWKRSLSRRSVSTTCSFASITRVSAEPTSISTNGTSGPKKRFPCR